jgi:protein-tyrosine-phosphatase
MKILCVCTHNIRRGPMLQAFLLEELRKNNYTHISVETAGTSQNIKGQSPNDLVIEVLGEYGLSPGKQQATHLSEVNINNFHMIICMEPEQANRIGTRIKGGVELVVANNTSGGIHAPLQPNRAIYQGCAALLQKFAREIVASLPARVQAAKA